jgi:aspartate/methionine/tyrosine aminotransferase
MTPSAPGGGEAALNPLATALNERLASAAPEVLDMLSSLGRRLYFPKGILSQGAEASARAHTANATIGIATEQGAPMALPSIERYLDGIETGDAINYASPGGRQTLREQWLAKALEENPSLSGKTISLPIVTAAITHGLSLVGDLFIDPGDRIVLPDKLWGNYRMIFELRRGAEIVSFPFFAGGGFDVKSFAATLAEQAEGRPKLVALLNFPNNPTGYMPTPAEGEAIAAALIEQAERGTKIVAVLDDAYFGLFYHLGEPSMTESLFGRLTGQHPNLLAVRLDGATKELFVWGLRCGFVCFGPGRPDTAETVCEVFDAKVRGAIRSGISNAPNLSQTLVERALQSPTIDEERVQKREILCARAERVHAVAAAPRFRESFEPYPFNSGYFMCVKLTGVDAERVRVHLLDAYGIGLIATNDRDLRIAFSCLELDQIEPLFEALHKAVQELR